MSTIFSFIHSRYNNKVLQVMFDCIGETIPEKENGKRASSSDRLLYRRDVSIPYLKKNLQFLLSCFEYVLVSLLSVWL